MSIRTGEAVSVYFTVAHHPCQTMIIKSEIPTTVTVGQKLTFMGLSFSPDTGSVHPSELRWDSDLEGPLGSGSEINNINLRPGLHKISLRAPDGLGGESVDSIQIEVKVPTPRKHTSLTHPGHTSKDHDSGRIPYKEKGGD